MRVRRMLGAGLAGALVMGGVLAANVVASVPAGATTTTVTNLADDGTDTSLRAILEYAVPGDVIELVPGATYVLDLCEKPVDVGAQISINPGQLTVFQAVTINGNGATIDQTCEGSRVILTQASLTLNDVTITGGTATNGGGGIRMDSSILSADTDASGPLPQGALRQLVINNSSIVGNCSTSNGGGFKMNTDGNVTITSSTIANNQGQAVGGGFSHSHQGDVLLVNSTVTGNSAENHAGIDVRGGDLTTVYSDIVDNTAGVGSGDCGVETGSVGQDDDATPAAPAEAANVYVNPTFQLFSFGTVIAAPHGGINCEADTVSSGYNFADDASCTFTGTGDTEGTTANPLLGALAGNGGPTQTLLPQTGSPLIDAIPTAACAGGNALAGLTITTDQRGLVRPDVVNQKCDIGSVEVQTEAAAPVAIEPNFTG